MLSSLRRSGPPEDAVLRPFRAALGRLVPEWREEGAVLHDSPLAVAEAFVRLLRVLGRQRGCLLVLEDLHWSDADTLSVLEYLADNICDVPALCLATVRSDEGSPALSLAHVLASRRAAEVRTLTRLDLAGTEHMAAACLGTEALPAGVARRLHGWAEGVPFLVEELLAAWLAARALVSTGREWREVGDLWPTVPATFAELVRRRLRMLDQEAVAVVQAAAVLGRQFDCSLLGELLGRVEASVLAALRRGVDAQLLVAGPHAGRGSFHFRHALTRDALLDELLPPERADLARRALEVVEERHPGLPGEWCEVAADLAQVAGEPERLSELLLLSGGRALRRGALATAETTLRRARAAAAAPQAAVAVDEALTEVLSLAGNTQQVAMVGDELLTGLAHIGAPPARRVETHLRLARAALAGTDWPRVRDHVAAARSLAATADERELLARTDAVEAHLALGEARLDDAVRLARVGLAAADQLGLPEVACEALEVLGRHARLRDLQAAEALFERALTLAGCPWSRRVAGSCDPRAGHPRTRPPRRGVTATARASPPARGRGRGRRYRRARRQQPRHPPPRTRQCRGRVGSGGALRRRRPPLPARPAAAHCAHRRGRGSRARGTPGGDGGRALRGAHARRR